MLKGARPYARSIYLFIFSFESTPIFRFHFQSRFLIRLCLLLLLKPFVFGQLKCMNLAAADVYLAGTVMLIFGMGLYGLFISNVSPDVPPAVDRTLKGSSLFGMFVLKVTLYPLILNNND